jgi:hypothetical protein
MRPSYAFIALFAALTWNQIAEDEYLLACAISEYQCTAFALTSTDIDEHVEEITVKLVAEANSKRLEQAGSSALGFWEQKFIRAQTRVHYAHCYARFCLACSTLKAMLTALVTTAGFKLFWRLLVWPIIACAMRVVLGLTTWVFLD